MESSRHRTVRTKKAKTSTENSTTSMSSSAHKTSSRAAQNLRNDIRTNRVFRLSIASIPVESSDLDGTYRASFQMLRSNPWNPIRSLCCFQCHHDTVMHSTDALSKRFLWLNLQLNQRLNLKEKQNLETHIVDSMLGSSMCTHCVCFHFKHFERFQM